MELATAGRLHHLELWVADYPRAVASLGWMLQQCGYLPRDDWGHGGSWQGAHDYVVLEAGPDVTGVHERRRAGLNHLALVAGDRARVDELAAAAPRHGWSLLFPERHPFAGGPQHYAAYLENGDGFEVELVAEG